MNAILAQDDDAFFVHAQPGFGRNFNIFMNQGIFAVRIDCAVTPDSYVRCIKVDNISSDGALGKTLADIPWGDRYPDLEVTRYRGNDSWGFETASSSGLTLECSEISNITSKKGFAFGIDLPTDTDKIIVRNNIVNGVVGNHKSEVENDVINPSSTAYGIIVSNTEGKNKILCNKVYNVAAPGEAVPFAAENAPNTIVRNLTYNYVCK